MRLAREGKQPSRHIGSCNMARRRYDRRQKLGAGHAQVLLHMQDVLICFVRIMPAICIIKTIRILRRIHTITYVHTDTTRYIHYVFLCISPLRMLLANISLYFVIYVCVFPCVPSTGGNVCIIKFTSQCWRFLLLAMSVPSCMGTILASQWCWLLGLWLLLTPDETVTKQDCPEMG